MKGWELAGTSGDEACSPLLLFISRKWEKLRKDAL